MPMRLWSTVVIHPQKPEVLLGRRRTGSARAVESKGMADINYLLKGLEKRDQVTDLVLGQVQVGHALPVVRHHRLLLRRVTQPRLELFGVVREDRPGEHPAAHEVRQV